MGAVANSIGDSERSLYTSVFRDGCLRVSVAVTSVSVCWHTTQTSYSLPNAAMPNKKWTMVRLPLELHRRLKTLQLEVQDAYEQGRASVPDQYCENVPLHFVIERAVDDWVAHRERSRKTLR